MELDVVRTVAEPVVRTERRALCVRGHAERHRLAAGDRAVDGDLVFRPRTALTRERLAQRDVGGIRVVRRERRRLVLHLVRAEAVGDRHDTVPAFQTLVRSPLYPRATSPRFELSHAAKTPRLDR